MTVKSKWPLVVLPFFLLVVSLVIATIASRSTPPDSMHTYKQNQLMSAELPALVIKGNGECLFVINRDTSTHELQTVDIIGNMDTWWTAALLSEKTVMITGHNALDFDRVWRTCTDALLTRAQHRTPTP